VHDLDEQGSRAVEFFDGHAYLLDGDGSRDVSMRFASFLLHFPEEERITRFRRKAIPTGTLGDSEQPKDIAEYQWRLTTPFATLLLAALAVPLARSQPRESRYGIFAAALLLYVLLFTLTGAVRNGLENGDLPVFPGIAVAYLPFALLLAVLLRSPRLRLGRWR
jgi:lipopolysaccharide export system permease protein